MFYLIKNFIIKRNIESYVENILAAIAVISDFLDLVKLSDKLFFNYKLPEGRGDSKYIKINNKKINFTDESYNSNPLSLKSAILNYDKINSKNSKKYLLLGDMLELGKHSRKLHQSIASIINQTKIDKVFVKGNDILSTFNLISKSKRGGILNYKSKIIELINNDLNNNDYLMVKASNATGFNEIIKS